jgi:glycosyltransferase involved in cell wall biosynthesis
MAMAVPVIAPQIGGLGEAIEQRKSGLLFPVGDVASLRACMAELVKDRAFARRMGDAAKYRLGSMFTLSRMIDESEALLTSLVK